MDVVALHMQSAMEDTIYLARQVCGLVQEGSVAILTAVAGAPGMKKLRATLGPRKFAAFIATATTLTFLVFAVVLIYDDDANVPANCPAQTRPPRASIRDGPTELLALAHEAKGNGSWNPSSREILRQCAKWEPAQGSAAPLPELRAQLEGHDALVATMSDNDEEVGEVAMEALALVERTRIALGLIVEMSDQCDTMLGKLHSIRHADTASLNPTEAIVALSGLSGFEKHAREALTTLKTLTDILEQRVEAGDWDAEDSMHEVPPIRIKFRGCLLKCVREARAISAALPKASPVTHRAQQCKPELLVKAEQLAFAEAEHEVDPGVIFNAGMLMSEVSVTTGEIPLFGAAQNAGSDMVEDSQGTFVPRGISDAEQKLLQGYHASFGPDETERAALRAIRLSQHAKYLMQIGADSAAEWRYRAGAELAGKHGREKLASHSLAQLSYFLSARGRGEMALEVANEAMNISFDPLASYLQVTLRTDQGLIRTDEEARAAADQLMAVGGRLPMRHLEDTRMATHANFLVWQEVSDTETFSSCLGLGDAAQVLICLAGKFAYM
jgi:hypothetical protein